MLTRRIWLALSVGMIVGIAALVVVPRVQSKPSTAERYIENLHVDGYKKTTQERRTKWAITTFWVGSPGIDTTREITGENLEWLDRKTGSVLSDGYDVIQEAQASGPKGPCYVEVSRANKEYWQSGGRTIPGHLWKLSATEVNKVRSGEFDLIAIDVSC